MKVIIVILLACCSSACQPALHIPWPARTSERTGTRFYNEAAAMKWAARDSFVLREISAGNIPSFLKKFIPVQVTITDSAGKKIAATYYVSPDYLSLGTDADWARVNITPRAAQEIADRLDCFLPTRKIVNDIYRNAKVRPEPVPMFAFRDSTVTMWQHHLIIEGQRKGRKGLIAGIKKDVVISSRLKDSTRVAIYGWHRADGTPIQPLYTGHIYWWVDYSQGIRLIYRKVKVNGKWLDYAAILADVRLRPLLCDEESCDFFRYIY